MNGVNEIFIKACKTGNLTTVDYLLAKVNNQTKAEGVIAASANGHLELVKYLVRRGADFQAIDNYAFRVAVSRGHFDVVQYLVENHVERKCTGRKRVGRVDERNLLSYGVKAISEYGHLKLLEEAVIVASSNGHLEIVKYLVNLGVDFQAVDNQAVRLASKNGHLEVIKYLVEKGAEIHGDEAIQWASTNGHFEIVKYFVERGSDFQAFDNEAIRVACIYKNFKIVKYLVEMGAPEDRISKEARDYIIRRSKVKWTGTNHSDFPASTNKLFGALFLGIQRLEETGVVPLAHQAMMEDILEGWSGGDDL